MNVVFRPSPPLAPDSQGGVTVPVARLECVADIEQALPAWAELAKGDAVASPYQSPDWVRLWHAHVVPGRDTRSLVVTAFDDLGAPMFIWPFACQKLGPFRIATFAGGKHATLNMALWRRDVAERFTAQDLRAALHQVSAANPTLDFVLMFNQPHVWNGCPNPFRLLPRHRSTEDNFVLRLEGPGQKVVEREISATMRSRLRNKERKLAKLPGYRYARAQTPEQVSAVLDAFFAQKASKLTTLGLANVFAHPGVETFFRAACLHGLSDGNPLIELHTLEGDGEILALFSGLHDGHRFTSNFNSHTASENSRYSPGLILLQHLVVDVADRGFESFDIGPGEARYKTFFCKEIEPIFDSVIPLSSRGRIAAWPLRVLFAARSEVKRNTVLWAAISRLRRLTNSTKAAR